MQIENKTERRFNTDARTPDFTLVSERWSCRRS
jgi:hypothetical protein